MSEYIVQSCTGTCTVVSCDYGVPNELDSVQLIKFVEAMAGMIKDTAILLSTT